MEAAEPKLPGIFLDDSARPGTLPDFCCELSQIPYGGSYGPQRGRGRFLVDSDGRSWIPHKAIHPKGTSPWRRLLGLFRKRFRFELVDILEWDEIRDRVLFLVGQFHDSEMEDVKGSTESEQEIQKIAKEFAQEIIEIKSAKNMEDIVDFLIRYD